MSEYINKQLEGQTLPTIQKRVGEKLDYGVDFSARLGTSETITSQSLAISPAGGTLVSGVIYKTGNVIWSLISVGTVASRYFLTFQIITDDNGVQRIHEQTVVIEVVKL